MYIVLIGTPKGVNSLGSFYGFRYIIENIKHDDG